MPTGPSALDDFGFREKIFHFDHGRIPERVVLMAVGSQMQEQVR
jgi:catalase